MNNSRLYNKNPAVLGAAGVTLGHERMRYTGKGMRITQENDNDILLHY